MKMVSQVTDSTLNETSLAPGDGAVQLLRNLHGEDGFVEFRLVPPEGRIMRFFWPSEGLATASVSRLLESSGATNVYFSVVPRTERKGTREFCGEARSVWCDYDNQRALPVFPMPPSVVVDTSPGKLQAYWFLDLPIGDLNLVEDINRGIAAAHGGDLAATDRARVLRLPGSRNQKYPDRPLVRLSRWDPGVRYSIEELKARFPVQMTPRNERSSTAVSQPSWISLVFDAIVDYLEQGGFKPRQCGEQVQALCPLHEDRKPSLAIHPVRGWYCHAGCGSGRLTRLANLLGVRV